MKKRVNQRLIGFINWSLVWSGLFFFWYNNNLFRTLKNINYLYSRLILIVMIFIFIFLTAFVLFKNRRNLWSEIMTAIIPYGIYTIIVYQYTKPELMSISILLMLIIAIIDFVLLVPKKINNNDNKLEIIKRRLLHFNYVTGTFITIILFVMMIIIKIDLIYNNTLVTSGIDIIPGVDSAESIENNMETIMLLQEDTWKTLSTKQKMQVLQTVANIESHYFGIPIGLKVLTNNLDEYVNGYYIATDNTINIDVTHIETSSSFDVLTTLCHEAYHSYASCLVDLYLESEDKFKNLRYFNRIKEYYQELQNYHNGSEDYEEYYYQCFEMDARDYANMKADNYFELIENYINQNDN